MKRKGGKKLKKRQQNLRNATDKDLFVFCFCFCLLFVVSSTIALQHSRVVYNIGQKH